MGILQLKYHCLFCRKKRQRVREGDNDKVPQKSDWKNRCGLSLCQILDIPPGKCSEWFLRGRYCEFCYQIFLDVHFVQSSIVHLQRRLKQLGEKTEALLLANWKDLESSQPNSSPGYAEALQCIGRLLVLRKNQADSDPAPLDRKRPSPSPMPSSDRKRIKVKPLEEILSSSDEDGELDNCIPLVELGSDSEDSFPLPVENQDHGLEGSNAQTVYLENRRMTRSQVQSHVLSNSSEVIEIGINSTDSPNFQIAKPKHTRKKRVRNPNDAVGKSRSRKPNKSNVGRIGLPTVSRLSCTRAYCKFTCLRKERLAGHVLGDHDGDPTPFHCQNCDARFVSLHDLDTHGVKAHFVVPDNTYKCPHCPRSLTQQRTLESHIQNVHFDLIFKDRCKICKKIFSSEVEVRTHESLHDTCDTSRFPYPCILSDNTFCFQLELQDHVNLRHEDEYRKFECAPCALKFFTFVQKRRHDTRVHQDRNPMLFCKFPGCSHYSFSASRLRTHNLTHQDLPRIKCPWPNCSRDLSNKRCLSRHLINHRLEILPSEAKYRCSFCSKGFYARVIYLKHLRFHREEREFICDQCPNTYRSSANLYTHKKIIHGEGSENRVVQRMRRPCAQRSRLSNEGDVVGGRSCDVCKSTWKVQTTGKVTACSACRYFFFHNFINKNLESHTNCTKNGDCPITELTRKNCRACRLKKCQAIGMTDEDPVFTRKPRERQSEQPARPRRATTTTNVRVRKQSKPNETCLVCGTSRRSVGEAFGIPFSCSNCRVFFNDTIQRKRTYTCRYSGSCEDVGYSSVAGRNYCSACRYQKCLSAGMKVEAVEVKLTVSGNCTVCNQTRADIRSNYGAMTCHPCRMFFWGTLRHNKSRVCLANGNCEPLAQCGGGGCRWRRCLEAGMKVEMVKRRLEPSEAASTGTKKKTEDIGQLSCSVCGDSAKFKYSGGHSCNACYIFFGKQQRDENEKTLECKGGSGSCSIDMLTRINCPACRFQKCLSIGMRKCFGGGRKKRATLPILGPCLVCGEKSTGRNYGVITCESCMYFFMKAEKREIDECREGGFCNVTKGMKCAPCRLQKCLALGMKRGLYIRRRTGRISRTSAEAEGIRAKAVQGHVANIPVEIIQPPVAEAPMNSEAVSPGSNFYDHLRLGSQC